VVIVAVLSGVLAGPVDKITQGERDGKRVREKRIECQCLAE